jgi:alkanesulfonate monooxygenase SsuD/methylene tetrahydromethanopterin reductase-like flavin-dependent oxidoreductase (luciferase family)
VLDRIVYPNYEPLVALAAAGAVTERIKLLTGILIAPYRVNAALLAKQAASVQALSSGRLVLGAAVGAREDDYEASGVPYSERGRRFDEMLAELKSVWAGDKKGFAGGVGPDVSNNPPKLVIGGQVDAAFRRAAEADGWIAGSVPPEVFAQAREKLESAWSDAGRSGKPYAASLAYFALGGNAEADAQKGVGGYYQWLGDYADRSSAPWRRTRTRSRATSTPSRERGLRRADLLPELGRPGAGGPARCSGAVVHETAGWAGCARPGLASEAAGSAGCARLV